MSELRSTNWYQRSDNQNRTYSTYYGLILGQVRALWRCTMQVESWYTRDKSSPCGLHHACFERYADHKDIRTIYLRRIQWPHGIPWEVIAIKHSRSMHVDVEGHATYYYNLTAVACRERRRAKTNNSCDRTHKWPEVHGRDESWTSETDVSMWQ